MSVIVLAVLGLVLDDTLTRLNALKQAVSCRTSRGGALLRLLGARRLAGGAGDGRRRAHRRVLGGRLAGRLHPTILRWIVVAIGVAVGVVYLVRG